MSLSIRLQVHVYTLYTVVSGPLFNIEIGDKNRPTEFQVET